MAALASAEACERHLREILTTVSSRDEVARQLIAEFGSLAKLLTASRERQFQVCGDLATVKVLATFKRASLYLARFRAAERPVIGNWETVLAYLRQEMAFHTIERVRLLHLDTRNMLILDELVCEGTIDRADLHIREVVRRALEVGSAALILVHNHPSGDPSPSRADIDVTRAIAEAGKRLGIAVHDHVIIGRSGHVSLRARGLL